MSREIPVIDMAPWFGSDRPARDAIARHVDTACMEWGFLIVRGHGIDPALRQAVRDVTYEFFDLTLEEKLRCEAAGRPGGRGYYRPESKSHARTRGEADAPGDLRETFFAGMEPSAGDPYTTAPDAVRHFAPNAWPARPARMQTVWEAYAKACGALCREMLHICAWALDLPETWFDDKIDRPISTFAAQHYPKLERPPKPGQVRSGAHTDFGTLTLLMAEDKPGGLQIMGKDGQWHDVKPVPGAYIVNLGDMMAQWTNDRWRSTLHRVVNPPLDAGATARRLSIVYFNTPNYDALIECIPSCTDAEHPPKYAPVRAGDHLTEKLKQVDSVARTAS
ncbi:MAG TPA: 2-oxoglutarate and iron-dependent oxygenase domain-containing protein [Alphaproteobacteria bacterium]